MKTISKLFFIMWATFMSVTTFADVQTWTYTDIDGNYVVLSWTNTFQYYDSWDNLLYTVNTTYPFSDMNAMTFQWGFSTTLDDFGPCYSVISQWWQVYCWDTTYAFSTAYVPERLCKNNNTSYSLSFQFWDDTFTRLLAHQIWSWKLANTWLWASACDSYSNFDWQVIVNSSVWSSWPQSLEVVDSWTITNLSNGFQFTWLETNADFSVDYTLYEFDWPIKFFYSTGSLWSFTGGLNNIDVIEPLTKLQLYEVELILTDVADPQNTIELLYWFQYNYNEGYMEPLPENFSYFVTWYTFFENWFSLNNFVPNPYWWALTFDIIAPSVTWTWTVNITTDEFYWKETDWKWYWVDTWVVVTYPYHEVAWTYQVRVVYTYDNVTDYPFWTDYNSYEITVPETQANYDIYDDIQDIEGGFFWHVKVFFVQIKDFFSNLMNIGQNLEPKSFSFSLFKTASADGTIIPMTMNTEENNYLTNLYTFLKWAIIFIFLVVTLVIIILSLRKE